MRIDLNLNKVSDRDLIAIHNMMGMNFCAFVCSCLVSQLGGHPLVYHVPENIKDFCDTDDDDDGPHMAYIHIYEKELCDFFEEKKGSMPDIVKALVRSCYDSFPVQVYDDVTTEMYKRKRKPKTNASDGKGKQLNKPNKKGQEGRNLTSEEQTKNTFDSNKEKPIEKTKAWVRGKPTGDTKNTPYPNKDSEHNPNVSKNDSAPKEGDISDKTFDLFSGLM